MSGRCPHSNSNKICDRACDTSPPPLGRNEVTGRGRSKVWQDHPQTAAVRGFLARAALAIGAASIFMETHEDPDNAPSDGPNMLRIEELAPLLATLHALDMVVKAA